MQTGKNGHRKKILFVVPSLQGGGEERVIVHLANHLDRSRYQPVLALGAAAGPYLKDVREDVIIHHLGAQRSRTAVWAVLKAVWTLRPHVVLSTLGLNFAVALARPFFPAGTRVIVREGSSASAFLAEINRRSRVQAQLYRFLHRSLYHLPHAVICQCDSMMADLVQNFALPARKLRRIYNPVDVEKIKALARQGEAVYAGAGPHLLTIGNMSYAKGYDVLLPAFRLVRHHFPDATLTFAGDGANRPALEKLTRQLELHDAVRFVGFQTNPFAYLEKADLFVSSSRYEGVAMVILEALACGTPVVATDCPGGNREVIEEGVNGWLAKPEDTASLAETICRGLAARSTLDRDLIRANCEARFSVNQITTLHEALF